MPLSQILSLCKMDKKAHFMTFITLFLKPWGLIKRSFSSVFSHLTSHWLHLKALLLFCEIMMWSYFSTCITCSFKSKASPSNNALFGIESFALLYSQFSVIPSFWLTLLPLFETILCTSFPGSEFFLGYIEQKLATNVALLSLFYIKMHSQEMHNDRKFWFKNDQKIISITLIFWLHD